MAVAAAMLLIMAAVGWMIGGRRPSPIVVHTPPVATPAEAPVSREPAKPPAPPRKIQVNSVPPADNYPLSDWNLENVGSGHIDAVTFAGAPIDPAVVGMLQDSDSIRLTGWAGDTDLGMRFRHVVFSMCERIVGSAPVELPRPDVARKVHPNLTEPGWTATLLIGHLPRCDGARLSALAVGPFGRLLFPLAGTFELPLQAAGEIDPSLEVVTRKPIRPEDADAPTDRISVEIKGQRVNLRSCGDTSCKVMGMLPHGKHVAVRLDAGDQWSLIVVPGHATGWVAESVAKIAPLAP